MSEKQDVPTKKDEKIVKEMRGLLKLKEPPVDKELQSLFDEVDEILKS